MAPLLRRDEILHVRSQGNTDLLEVYLCFKCPWKTLSKGSQSLELDGRLLACFELEIISKVRV